MGKSGEGDKDLYGRFRKFVLGYAIAYLSIKYATNNPAVLPYRGYALLVSYTLLIVPTFDVIRVALFRLYRGKPIFEADKSHIHHLVMAAGFPCIRHGLSLWDCFFSFAV